MWNLFGSFTEPYNYCGTVAERLGSRTCDQKVAASNPGHRAAECNPGQVVHARASVTKQYEFGTGQWAVMLGGWGGNRGPGGN